MKGRWGGVSNGSGMSRSVDSTTFGRSVLSWLNLICTDGTYKEEEGRYRLTWAEPCERRELGRRRDRCRASLLYPQPPSPNRQLASHP